jgi:ABC-type transport system involved in multi-copper enzyme maturation permease subunit
MKGLLLKDWYLTKKHCRIYLLASAVCLLAFLLKHTGASSYAFFLYPCLMAGVIPLNLLSYDESDGWDKYSQVFPYSKAQLVSAKYLIGLLCQAVLWVLICLVQAVQMALHAALSLPDFVSLMYALIGLSCMVPGVMLPFLFKFGVKKGRIYALAVLACFTCLWVVSITGSYTEIQPLHVPWMRALCLIGVAIYALSWFLSILFYQKREV